MFFVYSPVVKPNIVDTSWLGALDFCCFHNERSFELCFVGTKITTPTQVLVFSLPETPRGYDEVLISSRSTVRTSPVSRLTRRPARRSILCWWSDGWYRGGGFRHLRLTKRDSLHCGLMKMDLPRCTHIQSSFCRQSRYVHCGICHRKACSCWQD